MENERYWRDEPQEEKQEVRNWKRKGLTITYIQKSKRYLIL